MGGNGEFPLSWQLMGGCYYPVQGGVEGVWMEGYMGPDRGGSVRQRRVRDGELSLQSVGSDGGPSEGGQEMNG